MIEMEGPPGEAMADIQLDSQGPAATAVPLPWKDLRQNMNGGQHPWRIDGGVQSTLLLHNPDKVRSNSLRVFLQAEGTTWSKNIEVSPLTTLTLSINDIVSKQQKDENERLLPSTATSGLVIWSSLVAPKIFGMVVQNDMVTKQVRPFACASAFAICNADAGVVQIQVGQSGIARPRTEACGVYSQGDCSCVDLCGFSGSVAGSLFNWTIDNPAIARQLSAPSQPYGEYQGMRVGSAYPSVQIYDEAGCSARGFGQVVVTGNQTPVITSVTPNTFAVGVATNVQIQGRNFGTNPPQLSFSLGGTIQITGYSDTSITAVITAANTGSGSIGVTAQGYGGLGFQQQPGGGGQSANSSVLATFPFQGTLTAVDNFAGRSTTRFGVGEVINLSFTNLPGANNPPGGGLQWIKISGGGNLVVGSSGMATYTAPPTGGTVTLRFQVASGPAYGIGQSFTITVVPPDGGYEQLSSGIWHLNGRASVSFRAIAHLTPTNVSFSKIQFTEGIAYAVTSGFYAGLYGKPHPATAVPLNVSNCNLTTGCSVVNEDTVTADSAGPFTLGDFQWNIPWRYQIGANGTPTVFTTVNHHAWISNAAQGTTNLQKAGLGPFTKSANDLTTGY